jgi:starch synthase
MRIIEIAAEFAPLIKAGGLGDVLVGLSRELTRLGEEVEVIIPMHDQIPLNLLSGLKKETPSFTVLEGNQEISNTMWSAQFENIQLHLLNPAHPKKYFQRDNIYGYDDDAPRYLYFSRAVAEYLKNRKQPIDILHLHDWHTAAIGSMIPNLAKKIVLNIHNLNYQGKCGKKDLEAVGIVNLQKYIGDLPDSYNILKGGIAEADAIVPVSPTYAKEILTPEYGCGLANFLKTQKEKIFGILNGIDETLWNPATDPDLKAHFNPSDPLKKIALAKQKNREDLAQRFHLQGAPWVGAITRITPQKGPEFLEAAIELTIKQGGVFLLLGSSPIPKLQHHFEHLKHHYKGNPQVHLELHFDESLAHQLYAALDLILVPSHFEPCGLAQMIGMHYGTVPLVRETGGLKDTVFHKKNGFTFKEATLEAFTKALNLAFSTDLKQLIQAGLQTDFSWKQPTEKYLSLFERVLAISIDVVNR